MNARTRTSAMLASAVLAAAAMPAFGQTTIFVETAPSYPAYVPPTTYYYYTEPPIVVTPRDDDASINQGVVDTLASDPNLSGIVTTEGQSMRAERDAKSVYGVSNVQNDLTTRIGPHTH